VRQDQDKRYARQIMVPEVGPEGQALLSTKRVLIAGAGGLGTPCAAYLAGAGIGHIASTRQRCCIFVQPPQADSLHHARHRQRKGQSPGRKTCSSKRRGESLSPWFKA
jgi:hypothetical protein